MAGFARIAVLALALLLAACGTRPEERGVTGAGLGAAGGAILGAVTGLSVLDGALIGTAVGGIAGLLTDKDDLDIGDPFWEWFRDGGSSQQLAGSPGGGSVARTQEGLARLGYDPGPLDGVYGPRTAAAIREYQSDYGLPVTGQPSASLAARIEDDAGP